MPGPRGLVQLLDQRLHRWGGENGAGFPRGAGLLVAVSGGADSVALVRLLAEVSRSSYWRWRLVVGHVDHGLRGAASRRDARFVRALAKSLGLPCVTRTLRLPKKCSENTARQGRLGALRAMCRKNHCAAVVMAHHADDQAETVLMRLFRGTGIEGLAAMGPWASIGGMVILRPLLDFRRAQLREYLDDRGQSWCDDQTNSSDEFLRNRLRHQLMPLVETLWPRAVEAVGRLALLAGETAAIARASALDLWREMPQVKLRAGIWFLRSALAAQSATLVADVLQLALQQFAPSSAAPGFERLRQAAQALQGAHGRKYVQLGGGLALTIHGKLACIGSDRGLKPPPATAKRLLTSS